MACKCATNYEVSIGRVTEYDRAKHLLNAGKHPTFVGRDMVCRNALNGGLFFFSYAGEDVAVALLNARLNVLLVLNVVPAHRKHGLGAAALTFCCPTWIRSTESATAWFETRDYVALRGWKQGRRLRTKLLVRKGVRELAGRVARALGLVAR